MTFGQGIWGWDDRNSSDTLLAASPITDLPRGRTAKEQNDGSKRGGEHTSFLPFCFLECHQPQANLYGFIHFAHRGRIESTETFDQTLPVNRADLTELDGRDGSETIPLCWRNNNLNGIWRW